MGRWVRWEWGIANREWENGTQEPSGARERARFADSPFPIPHSQPRSVATSEIADSQAARVILEESRTHARCTLRSPAGRALAPAPHVAALLVFAEPGSDPARVGRRGARDRPFRVAALRNDRAGLRSSRARRCLARRDPAVLARRRASARSPLAAAGTLVEADRRAPRDGVGACAGGAAGSLAAPARSPTTCSGPRRQADALLGRDRSAHPVIQRHRIVRHALGPSLA